MKEALRNIRRRKTRSALTIFGVAIGIFAFTTIGSLSAYLNNSVDSLLAYYTNRISVTSQSGGSYGRGALFAVGAQIPVDLGDRIKLIDGVQTAYPSITLPIDANEVGGFGYPRAIYAYRPGDASGIATLKVIHGRNLTVGERGKVVVGTNIVQKDHLKLGQHITVKGLDLEVIGLLDRTGGAPDAYYVASLDDILPVAQQNSFTSSATPLVTNIEVVPKAGTDADKLAGTIQQKIQGVAAIPPKQFTDQIRQSFQIFDLIILGGAFIAVIVGGLSVINTMLISVGERRKEIGIKRVVGAKTRHILGEVVTETVAVAAIGCLFGSLAGFLTTVIINAVTSSSGLEIFLFTPKLFLEGVGFAVVLGALGGLYPAWQASRIKPVEALRGD